MRQSIDDVAGDGKKIGETQPLEPDPPPPGFGQRFSDEFGTLTIDQHGQVFVGIAEVEPIREVGQVDDADTDDRNQQKDRQRDAIEAARTG